MRGLVVVLVALAGCLEPVRTGADCASCHGSPGSPAPPSALGGETDTAFVGVGAHAQHAAVACSECHLVPATIDAEGHRDDAWPAEIAWGEVALADAVVPSWNHDTATCTVYCHGATLGGGSLTAPVWTVVDGTQAACGTCHGNPPPFPHDQNAACGDCHFPTADANGDIADPTTHGDGLVQLGAQGETCGGCHGSDDDPSPPPDTTGGTDPSTLSVGAHAAHVAPALGAPVACGDCHVVPGFVGAAGHMDGAPSEIVLGGVAIADAVDAAWNRDTATCTVYCHGATLGGGTLTTPVWTTHDGTQTACGTCHGNPPPAPHEQNPACGDCHFPTADATGAIADPATHVDGQIQVGAQGETCGSCHGTEADPSPPPDTTGGTDPSTRSVGAHAAHTSPANAAAVACGDCHVVPGTIDAAGHMDAAPAEVVLGGLADNGGTSPSYSASALTCSDTYCHGGSLAGGDAGDPLWTDTSGDASACGACHGMPPPSPHPSGTSCSGCHPPAGPASTIDQPARHIDGRVDR